MSFNLFKMRRRRVLRDLTAPAGVGSVGALLMDFAAYPALSDPSFSVVIILSQSGAPLYSYHTPLTTWGSN